MNNIIVYSTKTCPYCIMVKEYLKLKQIEFKEIDVSENVDGAMEMIKKSGQQGVPVLDVNGKIIVGFNKVEIDGSLK